MGMSLSYFLCSLAVASARCAMASKFLSAFCVSEFAKGYIPTDDDSCVSWQVLCLLAKKGLKFAHILSSDSFVFQHRK